MTIVQTRLGVALRGQEVRQMSEVGIPVIYILWKKFKELGYTGITTANIFEMISAGLVLSSMMKDIPEEMIPEDGKFHKMQDIQAKTLKGRYLTW